MARGSEPLAARSAFAALMAVIGTAAAVVALVLVLRVEDGAVTAPELREVRGEMSDLRSALRRTSRKARVSKNGANVLSKALESLQGDLNRIENRQRRLRGSLTDVNDEVRTVQRRVRSDVEGSENPRKSGGGKKSKERKRQGGDSDRRGDPGG